MIEITGNIFEQLDADAICFTSNGILDKNGCLVMGAGIAKEFKKMFPLLPEKIGSLLRLHGNHVIHTTYDSFNICSFPTKIHWKGPSEMWLIKRSAQELSEQTDENGWNKIYLPRPGVGMGGLNWEDVKKVIDPILDDRFYVINKE